MLDPISASALGQLVTEVCLACSAFAVLFFKGMSHSRCTKINLCCFNCDRDVIDPNAEFNQDAD